MLSKLTLLTYLFCLFTVILTGRTSIGDVDDGFILIEVCEEGFLDGRHIVKRDDKTVVLDVLFNNGYVDGKVIVKIHGTTYEGYYSAKDRRFVGQWTGITNNGNVLNFQYGENGLPVGTWVIPDGEGGLVTFEDVENSELHIFNEQGALVESISQKEGIIHFRSRLFEHKFNLFSTRGRRLAVYEKRSKNGFHEIWYLRLNADEELRDLSDEMVSRRFFAKEVWRDGERSGKWITKSPRLQLNGGQSPTLQVVEYENDEIISITKPPGNLIQPELISKKFYSPKNRYELVWAGFFYNYLFEKGYSLSGIPNHKFKPIWVEFTSKVLHPAPLGDFMSVPNPLTRNSCPGFNRKIAYGAPLGYNQGLIDLGNLLPLVDRFGVADGNRNGNTSVSSLFNLSGRSSHRFSLVVSYEDNNATGDLNLFNGTKNGSTTVFGVLVKNELSSFTYQSSKRKAYGQESDTDRYQRYTLENGTLINAMRSFDTDRLQNGIRTIDRAFSVLDLGASGLYQRSQTSTSIQVDASGKTLKYSCKERDETLVSSFFRTNRRYRHGQLLLLEVENRDPIEINLRHYFFGNETD